jgi:hypothetical protein
MEDPGGGKFETASICHEIKELSENFVSLKFSFIGRLANETVTLPDY